MSEKRNPDLDRAQRQSELQTQGGTDLDTTNADKPAGLESPGGDLLGKDSEADGPLTTIPAAQGAGPSIDPSGDDPFVPGTAERPRLFNENALVSERDKELIEELHAKDPRGDKGPEYEANQSVADEPTGGSTDPHNDLTLGTSGLQEKEQE